VGGEPFAICSVNGHAFGCFVLRWSGGTRRAARQYARVSVARLPEVETIVNANFPWLTGRHMISEWAGLFGQDSTATDDVAQYPPLEEVVARYMQLRRKNLQLLDSLSEIDLDKRTSWQPKGVEEHFATYGKALLTLALHQMAHRGQITDAIRSAGWAVAVPVGAEA